MLELIINSSELCLKKREEKLLAKETPTDQDMDNKEITNDK
jgi:hypothetical protein